MKLFLIIIFMALSTSHAKQNSGSGQTCNTIEQQYELLHAHNNYLNQMSYFNSFPDDYSGFIKCFGYWRNPKNKSVHFGCLYDNYTGYVTEFFMLKKVNKGLFFKKVLLIINNAYYQDDACSYLQDRVVELVKNDNDFVLFLKRDKLASKQVHHFVMLNQGENKQLDIYLRNKILR